MRQVGIPLIAAAMLVAACGSDGSGGETLAPLPISATTTSTNVPDGPSTSTPTSSSSTSSSSTSSTFPLAPDLVLRADSLGDIRFGVDPEATIDYVSALLGEPGSDTGWIDSFSEFGSCPGTEVRGVAWGSLLLLFGDESDFDSGVRHFFQWQYGPVVDDRPIDPLGPATDGGITLDSTVADIDRVYDDAEIFDDTVFGPGFELEPLLWGTLSDTGSTGRVLSLYGGTPCGE